MTPSTVSKLLNRIEQRLGVRSLVRSTRRLSLTYEGQIYYEQSLTLLAELDDIERELSQGEASAGGTVRVNASVAFGVLSLEPLLPAFWRAHPNIIVDLSLSDDIIDLYMERTDIAFRVGSLQNSTMMARRIGVARRKIVAAPAYLESHGMPQTIEDLWHHNCLGFNFRRAAPVWPLRESGRIVDRTVHGLLVANNGETVRRMALAGVGLARLGDYHVRADLAAGHLVEVLAATVEGDEDVNALYIGGGRRLTHRVSGFLDFMVPLLQDFLQEQ